MRAPAVSFIRKTAAVVLAALLTFTLVPFANAYGEDSDEGNSEVVASALADQSDASPVSSGELQGISTEQDTEDSPVAPMPASGLAGKPGSFINSVVALDSEPVIGSFTVDGLTYAVIDGPYVELVGVSPSVILSEGSEAGGVEESNENHASEAGVTNLTLPETVSYKGVSHIVSSIGAYAFYLSGVTSVMLPASVNDVDNRAFRSSDVANVGVAEGNPAYSSFDGALYDAERLSLLLIPEGKQGAVLLPKTAEVAEASVFSHCPLVDSISVEKDGAAFASENGLLYSSDLTTLLRVPAGATEITIREGCTTIAAGALEACAKLTTINAPATVTSISPDVFESMPTVSPLSQFALHDETNQPRQVEEPNPETSRAAQISSVVPLPAFDTVLPEVKASSITVALPEDPDDRLWAIHGFTVISTASPEASLQERDLQQAYTLTFVETIGVSASSGGTSLWPASDDVYAEAMRNAHVDSGRPNYNFFTDSHFQNGYYKCTTGIFHMYIHSRYGYMHICPDVWNPGQPDNIMIAKDAKTGRRLRVGSYTKILPPGITLEAQRNRPITFSGYFLPFSLSFNVAGGTWDDGSSEPKELADIPYSTTQQVISIPQPVAPRNLEFAGWQDNNGNLIFTPGQLTATSNISQFDAALSAGDAFELTARWERVGYDLGFDVDSEPGDEDYEGEPKDDQTMNVEDGLTVIEDPKRPGYVFQGWTIPNAGGTEAIDQDLVYQGDDGKWYVDASKLPDYAGDDGRVELTARWTSVISVDVPSSVTFYADVVTQGNESREGLASSAFGQSKVQSQSEVDLRIVGLESKQVKGNGSTSLGASDILKKKDGSTVSGTADKLLSLYPATGELTEDDLKDPDATSASKPAGAVDFSLDDILLEKSFAADEFTIPAGGALSLGYRLNLQETSTELDYDKLSALDEGTSASIANISYCFAADGLTPADWREPLWIEDPQGAGFLLLSDIKGAALDLSSHATNTTESSYYQLYKGLLDSNASFHLLVGDSYHDVHIIGICQDVLTDGGKAGLTFEMKNVCDTQVVPASGRYGYNGSNLQTYLEGDFYGSLDARMRDERVGIAGVTKRHQVNNSMTLQTAVYQHVFVPSFYEIFGVTRTSGGWNNAENSSNSFQYQHFAKGGANTNASSYRVKRDAGGTARIWVGRSAQYDSNLTTRISGAFSDGSMSRVSTTSKAYFAPCFAL